MSARMEADTAITAVRVCTACKLEKPATSEHFHAYKRAPDGCRAVCRTCRAADHAANREHRLPQRREHYQAHKERLQANLKAYYRDNVDAQREAAIDRYHRNREVRVEQMRAYREENRDALLVKQRARHKETWPARYGTDVAFTLKHRVRALLRATIKRGRAGRRTEELLGYTLPELRTHLERQFVGGMSWEKVLDGSIEIDHIVPVASFDITGYDSPEFRACWALSNLRPMWAGDNRAKGDKVLTLL